MTNGIGERRSEVALAVGAIGVVYGDLGTSPLYSIRDAFEGSSHRLQVDRLNVLGSVSIIVWTLLLIVAFKYVILILRADNDGEGGIMALMALVSGRELTGTARPRRIGWLVLLGLFGTALLFGDGMITPAISVISAVEGLAVVRPGLDFVVVPLSVLILVMLFAIQRFGSNRVGHVFGPVMITWFIVLAGLGVASISRSPEIFRTINPVYGVRYFSRNGVKAFLSMGSLFLVVTGGEALYADLGHFGRRPITRGWFVVVMPALLITYLGIGALLLRDPSAIRSPFFLLAPQELRLPLVILATAATVIASQALISGVFSLTSQAIQLGFAPRTRIVYTSSTAKGQIYVPSINWALMIACVGLVIAFGSSARLAAAFGLSVTGTMLITTILFAVYARRTLLWNPIVVAIVAGIILLIETAFFAANAFKVLDGGWFPLAIGVIVVTLFTTWKAGRRLVERRIALRRAPLNEYAAQLGGGRVKRVDGTAVFLHSQSMVTPPSLLALVRTTGTLHTVAFVVSVAIDSSARVHPSRRVESHAFGSGIHQVTMHYGFMDETRVADDLETHLQIHPSSTDYILGREFVTPTDRPGMARWRELLYALMVRNASDVAASFHLPSDRVVEIGLRVEI